MQESTRYEKGIPVNKTAYQLNRWQILSFLFLIGCFSFTIRAQNSEPSSVLSENVRIFDGKSVQLSGITNVLVRGNKIDKIFTAPIPVDALGNTRVIDGGGRTLMPGLIDM